MTWLSLVALHLYFLQSPFASAMGTPGQNRQG
jgi:hypothetical protein